MNVCVVAIVLAEATPKKILLHMNQEGITIAHIKSHLQVCESIPHSDVSFWTEAE